MIDISKFPFEQIRTIALNVLRGGNQAMIDMMTVAGVEKARQSMRDLVKQGISSWWSLEFRIYVYYCALMIDRGYGMYFTNVRLNGTPVHTVDVGEDFSVDFKPIHLESDQGDILMVHGCPDGNIIVGRNEDGSPCIRPLAYLKELVPKGTYFLASCFNGCKDPKTLSLLRSKGWDFILAGDSPAVSIMPIEPINYTMFVYSISKEDSMEAFGGGYIE